MQVHGCASYKFENNTALYLEGVVFKAMPKKQPIVRDLFTQIFEIETPFENITQDKLPIDLYLIMLLSSKHIKYVVIHVHYVLLLLCECEQAMYFHFTFYTLYNFGIIQAIK